MIHDIFPFVNVFVVTNILTRNYHEFYFILKFVAFYYTIYHSLQLLNFFIPLTSFRGIAPFIIPLLLSEYIRLNTSSGLSLNKSKSSFSSTFPFLKTGYLFINIIFVISSYKNKRRQTGLSTSLCYIMLPEQHIHLQLQLP